MIRRHGFTLIELLIVVTIIAILAGAAVPYVQDYVEQARVGRAKADLDEIKRAIMLYEVQYGPYTGTNIASLVGPFLTRNIPDPWGNAYVVNDEKSVAFSVGPDGVENGAGAADNISVEFRPRMAVTRVTFGDADGDGLVSSGDNLYLKTCRPISTPDSSIDNLQLKNDGEDITATALTGSTPEYSGNLLRIPIGDMSTLATSFSINKCELTVKGTNEIMDKSKAAARADVLKVLID